jgi:hypothetical protein
MKNLAEKENSAWTLKETIFRVFAYIFCVVLIWWGLDTLTSSPITPKDIMAGIGKIGAACVYLFIDIRFLISKNKRPNR